MLDGAADAELFRPRQVDFRNKIGRVEYGGQALGLFRPTSRQCLEPASSPISKAC